MATILIADDDELMLTLLRHKLEARDHFVVTARDGERALELAIDVPPDIIVLDVMMPGLDGFRVLQSLKADPATADIPVVMLTARKTEGDVVMGLKHGATDYLIKPFMPEEFLMRVEKVLREHGKNNDRATA